MNLPSSKPEEEQYQKIRPSDALKTLSSQGCSVDIYAKSNKLTFGVTTIPAKKRLGRMAAHGGDEVYYVLQGCCKVTLPRFDKVVELNVGDVFYMPAGCIHAPFNEGDEDVVILWACAPEWP